METDDHSHGKNSPNFFLDLKGTKLDILDNTPLLWLRLNRLTSSWCLAVKRKCATSMLSSLSSEYFAKQASGESSIIKPRNDTDFYLDHFRERSSLQLSKAKMSISKQQHRSERACASSFLRLSTMEVRKRAVVRRASCIDLSSHDSSLAFTCTYEQSNRCTTSGQHSRWIDQ